MLYMRRDLLNTMRKTYEEYEAEGMYMIHDDTPHEDGEIVYTAEELEEFERIKKETVEFFKHHFK